MVWTWILACSKARTQVGVPSHVCFFSFMCIYLSNTKLNPPNQSMHSMSVTWHKRLVQMNYFWKPIGTMNTENKIFLSACIWSEIVLTSWPLRFPKPCSYHRSTSINMKETEDMGACNTGHFQEEQSPGHPGWVESQSWTCTWYLGCSSPQR